ncbi:SdiA-regulated domain-containing protein [Maribacter sp. MAR_2009_72]|uniref:SdiA-regulated domain-containing protein n=1 Tax=Maribacter sp. MAR_2009_72 TaxID=1250050 RepID=UPI00119C5610|nr:SdiA-regulated domain-containing protein [Maribacter sp. MAR_2009_72]TVZ16085.1 SdiA-regulated protein [Maribacter sp. MAR_2009_72]
MKTNTNTFSMARIKFWTVAALIISIGFLFMNFRDWLPYDSAKKVTYEIAGRWELPIELREVSGIAWLRDNTIAAVQDEDGIIFLYDLQRQKVTQEIKFGHAGDYEGLAVHDKDAYVLESNGTITIVKNFQDHDRTVTSFDTGFDIENNMESLEYDAQNNRLLIIPKDKDAATDKVKSIYAFSLRTNTLDPKPIYTIDMGDEVLKNFREKKLYKTFRPSDMAIHPQTGEMYVLEGSKPKLLILDKQGTAQHAYKFDKQIFPQPEGITFDPDGTLYIASEGKKDGIGTITELKLLP